MFSTHMNQWLNPQNFITPIDTTSKFVVKHAANQTPLLSPPQIYPSLPSNVPSPQSINLWPLISTIMSTITHGADVIIPVLLPIIFIAILLYVYTYSDPYFAFLSDEDYPIPDLHSDQREFTRPTRSTQELETREKQSVNSTLFHNKHQSSSLNHANKHSIVDNEHEGKTDSRSKLQQNKQQINLKNVLPIDETDSNIDGENYFQVDPQLTDYVNNNPDMFDSLPSPSISIKHALDYIGLRLGYVSDRIFSQNSQTIKQSTLFVLMALTLTILSLVAASFVLLIAHYWWAIFQFGILTLSFYVCMNVLGYSVDTRVIERSS